jgi:hypothetical protein
MRLTTYFYLCIEAQNVLTFALILDYIWCFGTNVSFTIVNCVFGNEWVNGFAGGTIYLYDTCFCYSMLIIMLYSLYELYMTISLSKRLILP